MKQKQKSTTPGLPQISYFCGKSEKYINQLNPGVKNKSAFTLVELIIVITILAILGTIAYISFQGYTKDARDGVRISDIKQIYNGLSIYKTQTEKTLLPDNYVNILSGTTTISYQGYAGASVLRTLKISGGKDPGTKDYYIYTTDVNTKKAQLMTYMETSDKDVQLLSQLKDIKLLNQANAVTNTGYYQDKKIYVYGDKIGILTDSNKVPLQETTSSTGINILTTTTPITTYFGGNVYSGGLSTSTGLTLINQINGAITGKLPCNGTTYNGYTITSLQDSQSGSFIKPLTIDNGAGTGTIVATCNNGILSYSNELKVGSCNGGYHTEDNYGSCISNTRNPSCGGTLPLYSTATTSSTYSQTRDGSAWSTSYNWGENQLECDFDCNDGYIWDGSNCNYYTDGNTFFTIYNSSLSQSNISYTNSNLTVTNTASNNDFNASYPRYAISNTSFGTGKYYFEVKINSLSQTLNNSLGYGTFVGITKTSIQANLSSQSLAWRSNNSLFFPNGSSTNLSTTYGVNSIIGFALDFTNDDIKIYKDGNLISTQHGWLSTSSNWYIFWNGNNVADNNSGTSKTDSATFNFGQGSISGSLWCSGAGGYFYMCPPDGFKTLSSLNL